VWLEWRKDFEMNADESEGYVKEAALRIILKWLWVEQPK
jgi:hypothetical protein